MPKVGDQITEQPVQQTTATINVVSDPVGPVMSTPQNEEMILGLNQEEILNVNAISVVIPDTQTPIVVFFGAPSSGKKWLLSV